MAKAIGHDSQGLIDIHEKKLTELGLLTNRAGLDGKTISDENARLNELGLMFCANIESYEAELRENCQ
jgi:hypothetical protein